MDVLKELPEDIRNEIIKEYQLDYGHLKPTKSNVTKADEPQKKNQVPSGKFLILHLSEINILMF